MSQATFSARVDESKVRERRIPFEITSPEHEITREKAMQAFMTLREQSSKNYPEGVSLDDINAEISKVRNDEVYIEPKGNA